MSALLLITLLAGSGANVTTQKLESMAACEQVAAEVSEMRRIEAKCVEIPVTVRPHPGRFFRECIQDLNDKDYGLNEQEAGFICTRSLPKY